MQELENLNYMTTKQDTLYLLMKQRVEENITREVDLNRMKVHLTNLRVRSENVENTIAQQKRYLQILIGMPVEESFELDGSIVETLRATSLQTYPNPTTGIVYIDNPTGAEVEVYTLSGALLLRSKSTVIDLSRHAAGVYVIKAGSKAAKVVRQ